MPLELLLARYGYNDDGEGAEGADEEDADEEEVSTSPEEV
jgi:hypothetical protein